MKFSDIPQFTRPGSWQCDYTLKEFVDTIEKWQQNEGLDMNPDFQRGHVWTEEQQIEYIEFLLRGGKTAKTIYLNHPNWQKGDGLGYNDFVCVDGLQRSTAIFRFVKNELKVFGRYYSEFEGNPRMHQGVQININELQSKKEVLQWYLEHNTGGTVHSDEEIQKVVQMLKEEN